VASNKKEVKKEPEPELEPERQLRLVQFELPSCPPKEKVEGGGGGEEEDYDDDDEDEEEDDEDDEDDDDDDDNNNECDQPPECTAVDEVCLSFQEVKYSVHIVCVLPLEVLNPIHFSSLLASLYQHIHSHI
jgi:hypothetical protein